MDELTQKIPLWGPTGLYEANPSEVPSLLGSGYQPATEEQVKFTKVPEQIKAAGEAVGRGLGGGFFTAAERALGVDAASIENRRKVSLDEDIATAIEYGTMALPIGVMGKVSKAAELGKAVSPLLKAAEKVSRYTVPGALEITGNLASKGIEGAAAKLAVKYGVENALMSVSDDFGKKLVSDKPEDVTEVVGSAVAHSALSGLIGAGLGFGVGKLSPLWAAKKGGKTANAIDQLKRDSAPLAPIAEEVIPPVAMAPDVTLPPVVEPPLKAPATYEELTEQATKLGPIPLEAIDTPDRTALNEAIERLGPKKMVVPINEVQLKAVEGDAQRQMVENARATDLKLDETLSIFEQHQKAQSEKGIRTAIEGLSPKPVKNAIEAGTKWLTEVEKSVSGLDDYFEEGFSKFKTLAANPLSVAVDIGNKLDVISPEIKNYFKVSEKGKLKISPYSIDMPITRETYDALKSLVPVLEKKGLKVQNLYNARKNLYSYINFKNSQSAFEIEKVREILFDQIKEEVGKVDPSIEIRDLFNNYSKYKNNVAAVERMLGGSLSKEGASAQKVILPEKVIENFFKDTERIEFLKEILGEKKFNEYLGDLISLNMERVTKEGVREGFYSARNLGAWIKKNQGKLDLAFGDNAPILQEIQDWNTVATLIPDGVKAYPSRSGAQAFRTTQPMFKGLMDKVSSLWAVMSMSPEAAATAAAGKAVKAMAEKVQDKVTEAEVRSLVTSMLSGQQKQAGSASVLRTIKDWSKNTNAVAFEAMRQYFEYAAKGSYLISKEAKSIFNDTVETKEKPTSRIQLEKLDRKVQSLGNDLDGMMQVGGDIGYYAPEHATMIGMTSARAISYLNQQRPTPRKAGLLNKETLPNVEAVNKYYRTLEIAEQPTVIFKRLKSGTLRSSDIADLSSMYPELKDVFVRKLVNELSDAQGKNKFINNELRKGLSLLLGGPMDSNFTPESIQAAQATYQPQAQPQQAGLPQMAKKSSRVSKLPELTETDQQRRMVKE